MTRRVFFSFHYEQDVWRASVVRNAHIVEGTATAGFADASLWEESKKKGKTALEQIIREALANTSVTAVLIGAETSSREWVNFEIEESIKRGNGLLGIYIDGIKNQDGKTSLRGDVPRGLVNARAAIYAWDHTKFGDWVEAAARKVGK